MKPLKIIFLQLASLVIFLTISSCMNHDKEKSHNKTRGEIMIFHAGSLTIPFAQIADSFNHIYPDINIELEAAGSVTSARKLTDLGRTCDVIALADYRIIEKLLIPEYTSWLIPFAVNEMVLAYNEESAFSDKISGNNWTDILRQEDVRYGRSDPNADPCGYRTEIILNLAEDYYNSRGLTSTLLAKDTRYIRPKEVDLLSVLEIGEIDYIFIYRSVAEQHNLKYILLPEEINLGNPAYRDEYARGFTEIAGKNPGERIVMRGEPMIYAVTIPEDSPNFPSALLFTEFLLNRNFGSKIMEANGQPSVLPVKSAYYEDIPDYLKVYIVDPESEL